MIITCPNCQTRYRVATDALSAAGRQVQCAACSELWLATPSFPRSNPSDPEVDHSGDEMMFRADPDALFTQADENLLDDAFVRADDGLLAIDAADDIEPEAPSAEPLPSQANTQARDEALARRRRGMIAALPMARIRRFARLTIAALLAAFFGLALGFRTEIVRAVPQLDGLYRSIGLGTNVLGLDFTDVKTLGTTRDGNRILIVSAKISNITNHVAYVPSVLVSLINVDGQVLYEWTVTPSTRNILPGDLLDIDAQLTGPPEGVAAVKLSFVEGQNRPPSAG